MSPVKLNEWSSILSRIFQEVPSHEQALPFFLFRSKDYSEYKRILVEPFLESQFIFFRDFGPLTLTKNARIRHVGVGGEDVIQVWWEKGNSSPSPPVIKRFVYLVIWMLFSWEIISRRRNRSGLIPNKTAKNINGECITISDSLISGWSPVYTEVKFFLRVFGS